MRILTAKEMREVDRRAIEDLGIPSMVLMENAAIGVADALAESFPEAESVAIVCGPGNNGGDGLALARLLDARGYRLLTVLVVGSSPPSGDAGQQLAILERAGLEVTTVDPDTDLAPLVARCASCDLVVDALFGTGLSRPLQGHFADLVERLAVCGRSVLAVDLPSGLDGSRSEPPGGYLPAEVTVTFAAPKVAHVLGTAAMGRVVVTDLGIPQGLVDGAPGDLHLLLADDMAACLMARPAESHKGTFGHTLLIAGSAGKAGAAILAARAAVRGGSGLVTVAVPEEIQHLVDGGSLESMTVGLPGQHLQSDVIDEVLATADGKSAALLGPGSGQAPGTGEAIRRLIADLEVPLVIDADGLNALAGLLPSLVGRQAPTVLTPHPGEMARLLGTTSKQVQADRLAAARQAARGSGAVVVLKGHRTLIAAPEGGVWVNPTGNSGMATGGSGDVLAGLLTALLGQGYDALVAAQLAVYLHGSAGDLALEEGTPETLTAADLVVSLPAAFRRLRED